MTEHTRDLLLIAIGGASGAVARHVVGSTVGPAQEGSLPWHTFVVNVSGAFALGFIIVLAARHGWPGWWRPLIGVGLLGGYTTFSALSLETAELLLEGNYAVGVLYMVVNGVAATVGALVGILAGRAVT